MSNDREWYKAHKICPKCRVNNAFGNYVHCAECLEKLSLENRKRYIRNGGDIYSSRYAQKKKELRKKRIAAGLCPNCGKPAKIGKFCLKHHIKNVERNEKRRSGKLQGERFRERMAAGLCMYCEEPQVPGYKFCEKHLPAAQEKGKALSNANETMRKEVNQQWLIAKSKHLERI